MRAKTVSVLLFPLTTQIFWLLGQEGSSSKNGASRKKKGGSSSALWARGNSILQLCEHTHTLFFTSRRTPDRQCQDRTFCVGQRESDNTHHMCVLCHAHTRLWVLGFKICHLCACVCVCVSHQIRQNPQVSRY